MEYNEKQQSPVPQYPQGPGSPPLSNQMIHQQPSPPPMAYVHHEQQTPPPPAGSPPPHIQMQMQQPYNYGPMTPQPQMQPQPQQHQQFHQQPPMAYHPAAGSQYQMAVAIPNLGMGSAPVDCPSCGKRGMTRVEYAVGNTTHVWAGITFCFTLCLCFVPYMMNSLKDVKHHCGSCGVLLATWHKSGTTEAHIHA